MLHRHLPTLLLLVALVAPGLHEAASLAVGTDVVRTPEGELHPSILIRGDEEFLAPGSGVRGGSGTAADPYVISDYAIVPTLGWMVRLVDTRAHVVIRNMAMLASDVQETTLVGCTVSGDPLWCPGTTAISLENAHNVTVERLVMHRGGVGVWAFDAAHVRVDDAILGGELLGMPRMSGAIFLRGGHDLSFTNLTVTGTVGPVRMYGGTSDVLIADSSFTGNGETVAFANVRNVTFARNHFRNVEMLTSYTIENITLVDNVFAGGENAFTTADSTRTRVTNITLCGNRFSGYTGSYTVFITRADGVTLVANRFEDNRVGVHVDLSANLRAEGNLVANSSSTGAAFQSTNAEVHDNSFVNNTRGIFFGYPGANATHNWWGAADGPGGVGAGSGDVIRTQRNTHVVYDPWLEAPPPLRERC